MKHDYSAHYMKEQSPNVRELLGLLLGFGITNSPVLRPGSYRSRTQHLGFFFFFFPFILSLSLNPQRNSFFFFNIHVRISIVEILGLVLFLGWFNSCLFDFLRFYRAVAFVYAIELFD